MVKLLIVGKDLAGVLGGSGGGDGGEGNRWRRGIVGRKVRVFVALIWQLAGDDDGDGGDVHVDEVILETADSLIGCDHPGEHGSERGGRGGGSKGGGGVQHRGVGDGVDILAMMAKLAEGVSTRENELLGLGGGGVARASAADADTMRVDGGIVLKAEEAEPVERLSMPTPMALLRASTNQVSNMESSRRDLIDEEVESGLEGKRKRRR